MAEQKLLDYDGNVSGYDVPEEWMNNPDFEDNQAQRNTTEFSVNADPPPPYENSAPLQEVCVPAHGGRNYATEVIKTQYIVSSEEEPTDIDDIQDFMGCNVFACLCCCWPIGLLGIIFSKLCKSAKSEGKREQAKCYSVTAGALLASSVIGGIVAIIVIVSMQQA